MLTVFHTTKSQAERPVSHKFPEPGDSMNDLADSSYWAQRLHHCPGAEKAVTYTIKQIVLSCCKWTFDVNNFLVINNSIWGGPRKPSWCSQRPGGFTWMVRSVIYCANAALSCTIPHCTAFAREPSYSPSRDFSKDVECLRLDSKHFTIAPKLLAVRRPACCCPQRGFCCWLRVFSSTAWICWSDKDNEVIKVSGFCSLHVKETLWQSTSSVTFAGDCCWTAGSGPSIHFVAQCLFACCNELRNDWRSSSVTGLVSFAGWLGSAYILDTVLSAGVTGVLFGRDQQQVLSVQEMFLNACNMETAMWWQRNIPRSQVQLGGFLSSIHCSSSTLTYTAHSRSKV